MKLADNYFASDDVVAVARDLLGKLLCSRIDGTVCRIAITETEAYAGETDRASHAYGGRRTPRTEVMYAAGGGAYVYLCYGIHHLFNVVTGPAGVPHAVLVRAALPLSGIVTMRTRRGRELPDRRLMPGPGTVSRAMGITTALTGARLSGNTLWIEDHGVAPATIESGPRIGVDYAGVDTARPYRFVAGPLDMAAYGATSTDRMPA